MKAIAPGIPEGSLRDRSGVAIGFGAAKPALQAWVEALELLLPLVEGVPITGGVPAALVAYRSFQLTEVIRSGRPRKQLAAFSPELVMAT